MRNAEDFFKNGKAEAIEVIGIVTEAHVVHPITWTNSYKPNESKNYYELCLECDLAGDGGMLLKAYNEKNDKQLNKLKSESHPGRFFRSKTRNIPISISKTNRNKICVRTYIRCQLRGDNVNVPIYDIHAAQGQDTRKMRAGIEIPTGSKVAVRIYLKPYAIFPKNDDDALTMDENGEVLWVKEVGVTPTLFSVRILDEPADSVLKQKVIKSIYPWLSFVSDPISMPYYIPGDVSDREYIPSLVLENGVIVEIVRSLSSEDCQKMLSLKRHYPNLDFRIVFENAQAKLSADSDTTCGKWACDNGFKFADSGTFPFEWARDKSRSDAIFALKSIMKDGRIQPIINCSHWGRIEDWWYKLRNDAEEEAEAAREAAEEAAIAAAEEEERRLYC